MCNVRHDQSIIKFDGKKMKFIPCFGCPRRPLQTAITVGKCGVLVSLLQAQQIEPTHKRSIASGRLALSQMAGGPISARAGYVTSNLARPVKDLAAFQLLAHNSLRFLLEPNYYY